MHYLSPDVFICYTLSFILHRYIYVCVCVCVCFIKDKTWGWRGALSNFPTKCFNPSHGQHVAFPVIHHLTLQRAYSISSLPFLSLSRSLSLIHSHILSFSLSLYKSLSISPAYRDVDMFLSLCSLSQSVALSTF